MFGVGSQRSAGQTGMNTTRVVPLSGLYTNGTPIVYCQMVQRIENEKETGVHRYIHIYTYMYIYMV